MNKKYKLDNTYKRGMIATLDYAEIGGVEIYREDARCTCGALERLEAIALCKLIGKVLSATEEMQADLKERYAAIERMQKR